MKWWLKLEEEKVLLEKNNVALFRESFLNTIDEVKAHGLMFSQGYVTIYADEGLGPQKKI